MNTAILIPAYEPDTHLIELVTALVKFDFSLILVINDGSSHTCLPIFDAISKEPTCKVIHHSTNLGKGAALKTGFSTLCALKKNYVGCITVDADGQHLPEDILSIAIEFENSKAPFILGCRNFDAVHIPLKSRFGNILTRFFYLLFTRQKVSDTQTGLRAISHELMDIFITLPGNHYELEMNMLMYIAKHDIPIKEIKINTVYLNQNKGSHFKPWIDSLRIYKELLKFSLSSLASSFIDVSIFTLMAHLLLTTSVTFPLLISTVIARLISSVANYNVNKRIVFTAQHPTDAVHQQAIKYYTLCILQMFASWILLEILTLTHLNNIVILKLLADFLLFLLSFGIQKIFVFRRRLPHEKNA